LVDRAKQPISMALTGNNDSICWLSNFGLQVNIKHLEFNGWVWMLLTHQGPAEKFKGIIG